MNNQVKNIVKAHSGILSRLYYFLMNNKVHGKRGNQFHWHNVFLRGLRIRFYGKNNEVIIGDSKKVSSLRDLHIEIHGSNHKIRIEGGVSAGYLKIYCADNGCKVQVKENTSIAGNTELAAMEGTNIIIGGNCMFSANITLRAGDSHSVIDAESGVRLNQSKDIIVGNHVWIGNSVIITKGSIIGDNSVVATGSVVTGKKFPENVAIGGNPAKIIKENVNWLMQKI